MKQCLIPMTASLLLGTGALRAAPDQAWLDSYKIVWDSQSADARGSMPIGGGNIGLNVWVEKDELLVYFGSPDSWSYRGPGFNTQMQTKLGRLRLKFTPVAWAKKFRQELDLASNSIVLSGYTAAGQAVKLRVWIDAMQAVDGKILLFPAWPKDWDCEFKLHAPNSTTVAGVLKAGKLAKLTVTPETRAKDVVNMLGKYTEFKSNRKFSIADA